MPDALATLLAEQDRVRPMLDRLLALAALWMDPDVRDDGPGEADGAKGLRFAEPGAARAAATAATAAEQAESMVGDAVRAGPVVPRLRNAPAVSAAPTTGARSADGMVAAQGVAATLPAMPVASLQRLRERTTARGVGVAAAAPAIAASFAARPSPFAALAANAPGDAVPIGDPRSAFAVEATHAATTPSAWGAAAPMMTATPASPPDASRAAVSRAVPMGAATSAMTGAFSLGGALAEPPGDALEERLADILERAAAEAGIALP